MRPILIAEDDAVINNGIKYFLEKHGYSTASVFSCSGVYEAGTDEYSLIILDINLPDGNGLELLEKIRESSDIPVIFLTANDTDEDMVKGFKSGCDDYIPKPFSPEVLLERIKAVLRRTPVKDGSDIFKYKGLSVDFGRRAVFTGGKPVKLSATEYKLLEVLIRNKGQVVTRNMLFEKVWDIDGNYIDENTLSVHIRRLRNKLGEDSKNPEYIITVFGIGYTFGE
ncbi:response regulator transcription factor [Ruminococcus sp. Marseille-P6503]|uniref:response regulator transcription factor n=1 Tax=Ruminococcus sp. Marseille-P6503 TaxID=2364796 RepID=UPI000F5330C0|nr:response regulator transcription factor [Ruminococcus sp. Marseille-P6503]